MSKNSFYRTLTITLPAEYVTLIEEDIKADIRDLVIMASNEYKEVAIREDLRFHNQDTRHEVIEEYISNLVMCLVEEMHINPDRSMC